MRRPHRHWVAAIGFTASMVLLVAFAVTYRPEAFFFTILVAIAGAVAAIYLMFPGSQFFSVALANFLGVYTCIFIFFVEANFYEIHLAAKLAGYVLPMLAFVGGASARRSQIRAIVTSERLRDERHLGHVFLWLVPVFAIGGLTFLIPGRGFSPVTVDVLFLVAMAGISGIILVVSRDVSASLIDVGLLFDDFFRRMAELVVPAIAFFSFYSVLVLIFGSIYRILDRFTFDAHFMIEGAAREITFSEAMYFSIITLSTVGYGEIYPRTDLVRVIVAVEIILGVLLLLFGFSEIISYSRGKIGTKRSESGTGDKDKS